MFKLGGVLWLAIGFALCFGISYGLDFIPALEGQETLKAVIGFILFLIFACGAIYVYARKREADRAAQAIKEQQAANQRAENRIKRQGNKKKKKR
jgi:cbb3-type cytochrome oxidase subunit 3